MNRRRFTTLWIYTILKRTFADRSLSGRFTTLWIYTILKLKSYSQNIEYRFTTLWIYTILKLTIKDLAIDISFTTLWIYTILKPCREPPRRRPQFHYLMDLHYSQTNLYDRNSLMGFTTLWIYTILKREAHPAPHCRCFTTLWIYTILKHCQQSSVQSRFHYLMDLHYSQTRFSLVI